VNVDHQDPLDRPVNLDLLDQLLQPVLVVNKV